MTTMLLHLVTPCRLSFPAQKTDPGPGGNVTCTLPRAVGSFSPPYSLVAAGSGCQNKVETSHARCSARKGLRWEASSEATAVADSLSLGAERSRRKQGGRSSEDEDAEGGKDGDRQG